MNVMNNKYVLLALLLALIICIPAIVMYERKKVSTMELVTVAVMTALCALGRSIFAPIPGFKPVSAIVALSGAGLGPAAGFVTGALSAVVSNMQFGQGLWTPFQMAAWGLIGMAAGFFGKHIQKSRFLMLIFGGLSGIFYYFVMDVCTLVMSGEGIGIGAYISLTLAGLPVMAVYAVSDMIFLLVLGNPICRRLARLRLKYL